MYDPEAELEAEMMEDASDTTSDEDDDDTTISISDHEDEDGDRLSLDVEDGVRNREVSPVFYIDPEEGSGSNEEQQHDETLTEKSEQRPKTATAVVVEEEDGDVSLLRSVLCSPLGRMRSVSMMSASPPPPSAQHAHARQRLKRPNSLVARNLDLLAGSSTGLGSPDSAAAMAQQPRSLLRGRMRKTAIPLLGALVRRFKGARLF